MWVFEMGFVGQGFLGGYSLVHAVRIFVLEIASFEDTSPFGTEC